MKKALITGITSQDGSYLAELLLANEYEVHGIVRHVALEDPAHRMWRINHLIDKIKLHSASLESYPSIYKVFQSVKPDECYHLAAQSFVTYSFVDEFSTLNVNINGTHFVLSSLKEVVPDCKYYFAGSSEMFGTVEEVPQTEKTPFHPRSPYGISKVAGFHLTRNYRESYNIFACNGILFNHESPIRGETFVTRKITRAIARISLGLQNKLYLGNLSAKRDWGHAKDYVEMQWLMLQQDEPEDFVIATGVQYSVREFVEKTAKAVGIEIEWKGEGVDEKGYNKANGECIVEVDPRYFRPTEVETLLGDPTKAKEKLGWVPKITLDEMVAEMVEHDVMIAKRDALCEKEGFRTNRYYE